MSKKRSGDDEIRRLREDLARAEGSTSDLPYDLRWAKRVLLGEEVAAPEVIREEVVEALVGELVSRTEAAILSRLAGGSQRAVAKAARTGLHRLRSHKVSVTLPAPAPEQATPRGTGLIEEESTPRGLLGPYDTRGQRPIWLALPSARGLLLHQAKVSAEHGLIGFESYSTTRRKFRTLRERLAEMMAIAEVEGTVAHWFIEDAARRCQQIQHGLPEQYAAASQLLGAPPGGEHPALSLEPPPGTPDLRAILELRALAAWVPDQRFMERLVLRLQEIATSRIVVDERQRAVQSAAAIESALDEYLSEQRCQASQRILLDSAHLLSLLGDPAAASLTRAAADLFGGARKELLVHPLLRAWIDRVLKPVRDREPRPEQRSEGGLILPR
jgi:hypothetical protein